MAQITEIFRICAYLVVTEKSSVRLRVGPNWGKAVKAENGQEMRLGNL